MAISPELLKHLMHEPGHAFASVQDAGLEIKRIYETVIAPQLSPSPLQKSYWLSHLTGGEVWLKLESLNPNGSFKTRGALNAVYNILQGHKHSSDRMQPVKVCAASAGNHAQGVAYAASTLGCEAHIFLPKTAPMVKREATERLGAKIYPVGENLEEASEAAIDFAKKENAYFIHAYNNHDIIMGQATCAYECLLQIGAITHATSPHSLPAHSQTDFDLFTCSVGGGGLAAGAALALKAFSKASVIGIEEEHYDSALQSLRQKMQIPATGTPGGTIADGIAVGMIGNLNYDLLSRYVDHINVVNNDAIVMAILGLCERERIVAEGAGAAAVADILRRPTFYAGKKTIACISGGNIDPQLLMRIITRGLNITGRVLRVTVCVHDRPGGLHKLLECVASMGGNVLDLVHDRTYSEVSIGDVDVELSLETRDSSHQYLLLEKLEEAGFKPRMRYH